MIATHAPKMMNARLQQAALRAQILSAEMDVVSSATTNMRRRHWACPYNAADMAKVRIEIAETDLDSLRPSLPDITDGALKQILLPLDGWRENQYVTTTPVASMGLSHEVAQRLWEKWLPSTQWLIQPVSTSLSNHGEMVMQAGGRLRLLRRGVARVSESPAWGGNDDLVALTGHVESANLASGLICLGFPAMTAIGGLLHGIERNTNQTLDFAFGMRDIEWKAPSKQAGKRNKYAEVSWMYSLDTMQGNGDFVLLIRGATDIEAVKAAVERVTRVAGGSIFEIDVSVIAPGDEIPRASFLLDASREIGRRAPDFDALDAALAAYGRDGFYRDSFGRVAYPTDGFRAGYSRWYQPANGYSLNMTGYTWLETPQQRANARDDYPHVWSEPVFSLVTQGCLTDMAWWRRTASPAGVRWRAAEAAQLV
ncbi:hypothetical protein [Burkholderia plantarii]|uniref:hypothetical protein n=1 Tax=Burkholderia plantarii TaxID=41899 RepID=UPI0006D8BF9B|nr:hypothetical protein [Burkholderia plantarii]ALK35220.1 hypothetical protein bpln_1p0770 [Burkholderia plantarii]GLZ22883.1 hypothetical protein Bpla01_64120 [Burkholderia plantarii]